MAIAAPGAEELQLLLNLGLSIISPEKADEIAVDHQLRITGAL